MSKGFVALLVFAITLVITMPPLSASQTSTSPPSSSLSNDLQTKVIQDAGGNVHVLWLIPAQNKSATGPGIWYSKYSPNGTDTIPPTQITNSSTVQSADIAVDSRGNAIISWADDVKPTAPAYSVLYVVRFNASQEQISKLLTAHRSLIMWPSLSLDNDSGIYMTWTDYNPVTSLALVNYGTLTQHGLVETSTIASYEGADVFPPQARVVVDNSTQHIQIAWGESEKDGQTASTVNYAKLESNGTLLSKLEVAKFAATLRDVTISSTGHDGAFVAWQTAGSNSSLYVSQISPDGTLVYVKELNYTTGQSRYLTVSTDFEGNFYVVWYQPSMASTQATTTTPTLATNMTYLQMNMEGAIVQTGSGVFHAPVIGVTVLNDGTVYGVSPDGLVRAISPIKPQSDLLLLASMALMSCVGVGGLAGSLVVEDGRYRWAALLARFRKHPVDSRSASHEVLKLLARKPGMNLGEIKRISVDHRVSIMSLIKMENSGLLASFRDGLSRRFYLRGSERGHVDALRTRILLWVLEHPGIWEAQLAKDLGLSQQIVHYHLKKLRETNLITSRTDRNGTRKLYRFVDAPHRETEQ